MCYAPDSKDSPAVKYIRVGYMQNYETPKAGNKNYSYCAKYGDTEYRNRTMVGLSKRLGVSRDDIAKAMLRGALMVGGVEWVLYVDKL